VATFPTLIQEVLEFLARAIKQEKAIKGLQIRKEVKLFLFIDGIVLHLQDPKDSTRKLLEFINTFRKIARCHINLQKSIKFLYTKHKHAKKEIGKTIPFIVASKNTYE
jgi:hypothetical protein